MSIALPYHRFFLPRIRIYDDLFSHLSSCSSCYPEVKPTHFRWNRTSKRSEVAVFTDNSLELSRSSGHVRKIAWLLESPQVCPNALEYISKNLADFDLILTHQRELLDLGAKVLQCPVGGSWIRPYDWGLHSKSKMVSLISSIKCELPGHKLRHEIASTFRKTLDLYGGAYHPIRSKLVGHRDYCFSVVIENCRSDFYFTEKLIDALACGSIPIYWGCPSIDLFFDSEGIFSFESIEELADILATLSPELYWSKLEAVKNNLMLAKRYAIIEDWMWENHWENHWESLFAAPGRSLRYRNNPLVTSDAGG